MAGTRRVATKSAEPADEEVEADVEGDEEDEDEDVPEEEYEVDKVLDHKKGDAAGKYLYLVSWKGYGPEHNTWEPQENLKHATGLVSGYWNKLPKPELGVKKRGRQSTSSQPAPRVAKAPRQSATSSRAAVRNGKQRAEPEEEEEADDMEDDFVKTHIDNIDKYADVKDWEKVVAEIDTIERGSDNKLLVYMTMIGGERVAQPTTVAYARCPQKLLKFYEQHLKWRVGD